MGGDRSMDPDELASFAGFRGQGHQVHIPNDMTCHSSGGAHAVKDYFVTSERAGAAMQQPKVDPSMGLATRGAVRMQAKRKAEWPMVK
eukprot:7943588-Pyramimonas_sp.AAC.1